MKIMELKLEHLNFLLPLPEQAQKDADEFLGMADTVPIAVTLNGENFVLMKEENFEELLSMDENDFPCEDCEDCENEGTAPCSLQVTEEEMGYATVSLVLGLLEDVTLNSHQLAHLEEIISAYQLLATAREIYGGEDE